MALNRQEYFSILHGAQAQWMLLLQLHYLGLEGQGKIAWINSSIVIFTQYSQWVGGGAVAFLLAKETKSNLLPPAFIWVMIGGILFFSGSIYLLSTGDLTGIHWKILGPITPIGGLFFIAGWIYTFIQFLKKS